MTRKSRTYPRLASWQSASTPTNTLRSFKHISPTAEAVPAFFTNRENLFSEDHERSWVEFLSARRQVGEKGTEDKGNEWMQKITDEGTLAATAQLRTNNPIHIFFIRQKNSNSPLLLTRDMFDALINSNEVFVAFKEFVLSFGWKHRELDIGPPHCRFQINHNVDESYYNSYKLPNFECAYGIRYVELNDYKPPKDPWSVRQTAVYQKYMNGKQTWIFISPSNDFQASIEAYIRRFSDDEWNKHSANPFELHSILIACALGKWRWYIQSLVERATERSNRVIAANVGEGKRGAIDINVNFEDRQNLKVVEDKVLDLFTIFDSVIDTIMNISQEYRSMATFTDEWSHDPISSSLRDSLRAVQLYRKKADNLHRTVQGTASLLSDLLDNENAKIAEENGKSLAILAEESRQENVEMRKLTEKGTSDAAAVKVITLITIMFLPTTVVAGFFSTQFVKESDNKLELTDNWWLIVAISLPLTVITMLVWYCWVQWQMRRETSWKHDSNIEDGRRPAAEAYELDPFAVPLHHL